MLLDREEEGLRPSEGLWVTEQLAVTEGVGAKLGVCDELRDEEALGVTVRDGVDEELCVVLIIWLRLELSL